MKRGILLAFALLAATTAGLAAQEVAVYRWYHGNNWHFYTSNAQERPGGWSEEGIKFRLFRDGTPGTQVLYRIRRNDGGHFYTSNPAEVDAVKARGWVVEGSTGSTGIGQLPGTVPLHRFHKPQNGRHFYTIDKGEGDRAGFQYEGVIGYVLPSALPSGPAVRGTVLTFQTQLLLQKCLDVPGASRANNTPVQLYSCNNTAAQLFIPMDNGQIRVYGDMCLTSLHPHARGARIGIYACDEGPMQKWQINGQGVIRSAATGFCLDVANNNPFDGAHVVLWDCHQGPNQRWSTRTRASFTVDGSGAVQLQGSGGSLSFGNLQQAAGAIAFGGALTAVAPLNNANPLTTVAPLQQAAGAFPRW